MFDDHILPMRTVEEDRTWPRICKSKREEETQLDHSFHALAQNLVSSRYFELLTIRLAKGFSDLNSQFSGEWLARGPGFAKVKCDFSFPAWNPRVCVFDFASVHCFMVTRALDYHDITHPILSLHDVVPVRWSIYFAKIING